MSRFRLAFGVHNHQPVGNFTAVFEKAHTRAYLPFLEVLSDYPDIRLSLHQSGILWEWQKRVHPEYFELVGRLLDRGQVELLTGGFYEPILSSVPSRDARGQIALLTKFLQDHFGTTATGLWLTERIWEPHLPKVLADADIEYLPIDDTHFLFAGMDPDKLTGPFVTEDEGATVRLLPIQKQLRYLIPFGTVEEVMNNLRTQAERRPGGMAIYADDGEKFGIWPQTHQHCYEDGWLREFFAAVQENSAWLEVVPLDEVATEMAAGMAYLPSASYAEMTHWSLPPDAYATYESFERWLEMSGASDEYRRFVRGGHWRGFLAKYPEANLMHKKMLKVSGEVRQAAADGSLSGAALDEVTRRLYAGQCNCAYWHGVFGGLYLPHIRQAVYTNLIEAHRQLRISDDHSVVCETLDYDCDGLEEAVVDSPEYTAVFAPGRGGSMIELSLNKHGFNVTDTLTRRHEGYHPKVHGAETSFPDDKRRSIHREPLAKEQGLRRFLRQDWYRKRCFIDHFLTLDVDLDAFHNGNFGEEGDFVLERYDCRILQGANRVILSRDGGLWRPEGRIGVSLTKEFTFEPGSDRIQVDYLLATSHPGGADVNFAIENNFNFQAGHAEDRYILIDNRRDENAFLDSVGAHSEAEGVALIDEYRSLGVALTADVPAEVWHLPLFTVSLSEGGFERVYQGTTVLHRFRMRLTEDTIRLRFMLHAGAADLVRQAAFAASGSR
ncbi:DUF1926 domain-containing protein [candidate division GN15 bacterium]|nr:DUF1926 domain-containing protein [candidate division GN15 bacterium]